MVDDEGWTFEAWRNCLVCKGRPPQGQTAYKPNEPQGCICTRTDDPNARHGKERKVFATRAEVLAFMAGPERAGLTVKEAPDDLKVSATRKCPACEGSGRMPHGNALRCNPCEGKGRISIDLSLSDLAERLKGAER
jgi:hypothetical protein